MKVFVGLARSSHLPSSIFHLTSIIMPVFVKVSQNKITDSKSYGKWYGRVVSSKTMTYQELCKHMSEHNSVFGEDVCLGVANKLQTCILEQLLEGKKVQFGELGTFYLSVKSTGADEEKDYSLGINIQGLYLCFAPSRTDVNNLSSKMLKKKASFMNVKDLTTTKPKSTTPSGSGSGSGTGTENQGNEGSSQNGNEGNSQSEQPQTTTFALTISKTGSGSATVTKDGNAVTSGASLSEDDELVISITPAEDQVPTATLNGSSIELTENDGVYSGNFAMPGQASTLIINTGESDDYDPNA